MNVYYVKSPLTIKKVALQSYIDLPAKIDWNLTFLFQILKRCLVIFTLLTLIFQLLLAILMLDQMICGLGILKHLEAHELILSQLVMALDN